MRHLAAALGLFTLVHVSSCLAQMCTLVGCSENTMLVVGIDASASELDRGEIEVCRNATCAVLTLQVTDSMLFAVTAATPFPLAVNIYPEGTTLRFDVTADLTSASVGDAITLRIVDETDIEVRGKHWSVIDVTTTYPNGEDCGPECKTVTLADAI